MCFPQSPNSSKQEIKVKKKSPEISNQEKHSPSNNLLFLNRNMIKEMKLSIILVFFNK